MNQNVNQEILEAFDEGADTFNEFRIRMHSLITDLIKNKNIQFHQITSRVKDRESLAQKITNKAGKYNELFAITDIIGIRVITYLESDIDEIAQLIENQFKVDKENSIDKRKLNNDQFGYRSLHYIVSNTAERDLLPEYQKFTRLKIEIQVRSILQHAWAEIEHDLGYKGLSSIPDDYKRSFNRVSALLESADVEFDRLKNDLSEYEETVAEKIKTAPENTYIDQASLISFVSSNEILNEAQAIISRHLGRTFYKSDNYSGLIHRFKFLFNIETIEDLKQSLLEHKELYLAFVDEFIKQSLKDGEDISRIPETVMIFHFQHFLASLNNDQKKVDEYIRSSHMLPENGKFLKIMEKARVAVNEAKRSNN